MLKITIKTKKGVIHSFDLDRGEDLLSTLDKFLKMNRIDLRDLSNFSVDCGAHEDSISCRMAKSAIEAIKLSN